MTRRCASNQQGGLEEAVRTLLDAIDEEIDELSPGLFKAYSDVVDLLVESAQRRQSPRIGSPDHEFKPGRFVR